MGGKVWGSKRDPSDQGSNFESAVFSALCDLLGVHKTRTTPRNPKSDGLVERQNGTLERLLAMVVSEHQFDWDDQLPFVVMAYRSSVQESTKESPNMMCMGREIMLPIDLVTPPCPNQKPLSAPDFVLLTQERLREAHEHARVALQKAAEHQKKGYQTRFHENSFNYKDLVWYFWPQVPKGKSPKFIPKWTGPWVVIQVLSPVLYRIQKDEKCPSRVVHHDHLKPCFLREEIDLEWVDRVVKAKEGKRGQDVCENDLDLGLVSSETLGRPRRNRQKPNRYGEWYEK